jgi:hypothetical protein
LKIGGCMWKAVIPTSWGLEIATGPTTRNEDENGSVCYLESVECRGKQKQQPECHERFGRERR